MNTALQRVCLTFAVLFVVAAQLSAGENTLTLETTMVEGLTVTQQENELRHAREILQRCDELVMQMKARKQSQAIVGTEEHRKFISTYKPTVLSLIQSASEFRSSSVGPAVRQITEVTNVLLIALGYDEANAFETIVSLYQKDREAALATLDGREQKLPRLWKSRTGTSSVIAELKTLQPDSVVLHRLDDGREITVPREKLSLIDRRFLNRWDPNVNLEGEPKMLLREIGVQRRVND
ncbi:MAG: SHD1 domain-containing protein [Pirellulaceae bacterium]|nr:SHD1 domain-containing protein [Pirellulaceae bacterium]